MYCGRNDLYAHELMVAFSEISLMHHFCVFPLQSEKLSLSFSLHLSFFLPSLSELKVSPVIVSLMNHVPSPTSSSSAHINPLVSCECKKKKKKILRKTPSLFYLNTELDSFESSELKLNRPKPKNNKTPWKQADLNGEGV